MNKQFCRLSLLVFVLYVLEFVGAVAACNFYSDVTRTNTCVVDDDKLLEGDEASWVYDVPIKMCAVYHIIQWIRCAMLIASITMGSSNLMWLWYLTLVNNIYGFIAFLMAVNAVFISKFGEACSESQQTRYEWLFAECIYFFSWFFLCMCPVSVVFCYSKRQIHTLLMQDDGDSDEEEN